MAPEQEEGPEEDEGGQSTSKESGTASVTEGQVPRSGRPSYVTRNLTRGSISGNLWFLAWPQMVEASLNVVDQLADLVWAGRLGSRAIAGLGVAQTYTQLVMMLRHGMDLAIRAMISRAVGAGDLRLANHAALQGLTLSLLISLVITIVGIVFTDPLLRITGVSDEVIALAATYMRVQFLARAFLGLRMTGGAMLQSAGDAVTPMRSTVVTRVIHIGLSPFLVFGWWWFPNLALPGVAVADLLAQLVGCEMVYVPLFRGTSRLRLSLRGYRVDPPFLWRLMKIGAPAAIAGAERGFAQLALLFMVTPFGDLAVAAFSITRRVETLFHAGSRGLGQASGTLIGQNLGAEQPERAKQTLAWALVYAASIGVVMGVAIMIFPRPVLRIFNSEPELLDVAVVWLQIQGIAFLFMAPSFVFQQSFNIAGETIGPMVVTLIAFWGVQIPFAWGLSQHTGLGQYGIAWSIVLSMVVRNGLFVPLTFWGRWLRVKVV